MTMGDQHASSDIDINTSPISVLPGEHTLLLGMKCAVTSARTSAKEEQDSKARTGEFVLYLSLILSSV
jgi:hypothetical protein